MDDYVKLRIQEIPIEIRQSFLKTKQVWKCESEFDFLYGYYVGKIEEGALHYLQKATRAFAGSYADLFEIRGVIEAHRNDLRDAIKRSVPT